MGERTYHRADRSRADRRPVLTVATLLFAATALTAQPDPPKKPADPPKAAPKEPPPGVRLPDGTFLWTGDPTQRVELTPQDYQKLIDQADQLKKLLAGRKAAPPSGCALSGRVEERGKALVAALKATYTFRTTAPNAAVALGGKRAFLVAAALDGKKQPILDTGEDGFAALVEATGDHTLTLDLEAPVSGRGTKGEVGFDLGLPRAAITTLKLVPPANVARLTVTTRTPDPAPPAKAADPRRVPLDAAVLAADRGYPLGPVESVEVAWEPPAAVRPADLVRTADVDVLTRIDEGFIETTGKMRPRGPAGTWRIVAPPGSDVRARRVSATDTDTVPPPAVTPEGGGAKTVWKVELPNAGAGEWVITASARQPRPKGDGKKTIAACPFAVLDVVRQTGTVRVSAPTHTLLRFKHGPEFRRDAPPGPADDQATVAFFRLSTGATGSNPALLPQLAVEATPIEGRVLVRPAYKLELTEAGWRVRAEVHVEPVSAQVEAVTVEVPAEWPPGVEASSPTGAVVGVTDPKGDGPRQVVVRLNNAYRTPFDFVLKATVPVPPTAREAVIPLPRFPTTPGSREVSERDAQITVTVPDGLEVRGSVREWEGNQLAGWGRPLAPVPGAGGKPPKVVAAVAGKFDRGLARADLSWHPFQPELTADVRAEVRVQDHQVVVEETVKVRSPDGFGRPVRFRGPADVRGLRAPPRFEPKGPGEWELAAAEGAKELDVTLVYAVPFPADRAAHRVAVGLIWPAGTTHTTAQARVWAGGSGRAVAVLPGPWRELPPEPAPDRDALPAATLAGTGADLPLALDVRDPPDAAAVTVERAVIQALVGDTGPTTYRARFLLRRWLTNSVEVRLPGPLAGSSPVVTLDGNTVGAPLSTDPADPAARVLRVPLPDARLGRPPTAVLEVRYQLPANRGPWGDVVYSPPRLPAAAFAEPVRWQVTGPPHTLPLLTGAAWADQRWRWRDGLFAPVAADAADGLDRWFKDGADGDDSAAVPAEVLDARQPEYGPLRVHHVPRAGLILVCSVLVFLVELLLTRLPRALVPPALTLLGGLLAAAAVLAPQPAAQAVGAAEPGQAAAVLVLAGVLAVRWYHRHRVTHLPGFTRARPAAEPSAGSAVPALPAPSGRGRPLGVGSTGTAAAAGPVAPTGA